MSQWHPPPDVALVLIHAVNPYGFSWIRRTNEHNVDQNRNFLRQGEKFRISEGVDELNAFLNPKSPPDRYEFFSSSDPDDCQKGLSNLKNSVAMGSMSFLKALCLAEIDPKSHIILKEIYRAGLGMYGNPPYRFSHRTGSVWDLQITGGSPIKPKNPMVVREIWTEMH